MCLVMSAESSRCPTSCLNAVPPVRRRSRLILSSALKFARWRHTLTWWLLFKSHVFLLKDSTIVRLGWRDLRAAARTTCPPAAICGPRLFRNGRYRSHAAGAESALWSDCCLYVYRRRWRGEACCICKLYLSGPKEQTRLNISSIFFYAHVNTHTQKRTFSKYYTLFNPNALTGVSVYNVLQT